MLTKNTDKIIIFDWGGVVESHEHVTDKTVTGDDAWTNLLVSLGHNVSKEKVIYIESLFWNDFECGHIKLSDMLNEVYHKTGLRLAETDEEFEEAYQKAFDKVTSYNEIVEYAHSLKDRCNIGILSNLNELDKVRIDKHMNLSIFDNVWLSFELGYRKPDNNIYKIIEKQYKKENIMFIDDNLDNIKAASGLGWFTHYLVETDVDKLDKIKKNVEIFLKR